MTRCATALAKASGFAIPVEGAASAGDGVASARRGAVAPAGPSTATTSAAAGACGGDASCGMDGDRIMAPAISPRLSVTCGEGGCCGGGASGAAGATTAATLPL